MTALGPRAPTALLLAVLLVVLAPGAGAQTLTNPVQGEYSEIYLVSGRIVDVNGLPVAGADVRVELIQRGASAEPWGAKTNCFGDFVTWFNLRHVDPRGKVRITLPASDGASASSGEVTLDPFFRRSHLTHQLDRSWGFECPQDTNLWPGRISVMGRVLNRTEPYMEGGFEFNAKPYVGLVLILLHDPATGAAMCPPAPNDGQCEYIATDERGDFRYSFTFPQETPAVGRVEVIVGEKSYNATIDAEMRLAYHAIDLSGKGAPRADTPGAPVGALLLLVALAAGARSVLRAGRR